MNNKAVSYAWIVAGATFGDWTATGVPFLKGKHPYVPVSCACGFASEVYAYGLVNGGSQRCRPCSGRLRMATKTMEFTCPQCSTVFRSSSPRSTVCPPCRPEHQREVNRKYMQAKGPEYLALMRRKVRGKKYGLTLEEFDRRIQEQQYLCAVCKCDLRTRRREPALDHDHACCNHVLTAAHPACGRCARGFLCDGCNHGLGIADNIELLLLKAAYLQVWVDRRASVELEVA